MSLSVSTTQKISRFWLYALLCLPLLVTTATSFSWTFGKTILFQFAIEALLVFWLWQRNAFRGTRWGVLDYCLVIFLGILILAAFTGVNATASLWGNQARANGVVTWLHLGFWYLFLRQTITAEKHWQAIFTVSVVAAVLVSLTVIWPTLLPLSWRSGSGGGILGNRAFAAAYLVVNLGLVSWLIIQARRYKKIIYAVPAALLVVGIVAADNRGALIGLAAGVLAALLYATVWLPRRGRAFALVAVLLALVGAGWFLTSDHFTAWVANKATAETRLMAWGIAWQGMKERPLLGWGANNFDVVFNKYYNPQFLKHSFAETVWDKPHNWLLEIGVSAGWVGIVSYLSLLVAVVICLRPWKTGLNWRERGSQLVIFSTLIALGVQNLFLFETINTALLFFLLLAYSAYVGEIQGVGKTIKPWSATVVWLVCPVVVLGLLLVVHYNYVALVASARLNQAVSAVQLSTWANFAKQTLAVPVPFEGENAIFLAERFIQLDKGGALLGGDSTSTARLVAEKLEAVAQRYSDNPLPSLWAGQIYMVLGEKVDPRFFILAEQQLTHAKDLAPQRQETLFYLGRLYLLQKDFAKALAVQKQAVELAPTISTSHWFYGLTFIGAGQTSQGLAEIEEAFRLGYVLNRQSELYVIDLYAAEKRYDKVVQWYEKLHQAEPDNINWYIKLATAYAVVGDKEKALATVKEAVALYPPLEPEAQKFIKEYFLDK